MPLALHDWSVDFAVWCTYKYLNAGPGAVAGCFVHERHGRTSAAAPGRLVGQRPGDALPHAPGADFVPSAGADGWQLSNPPILSLAPAARRWRSFDEATMPAPARDDRNG